jgi:hypothetical protein
MGMPANPIVYLLLRDLENCAVIIIFAMVIMGVFAVLVTFIANNPDDFMTLPKWLIGNWVIGVATTAGLWILTTAVLQLTMPWLPDLINLHSTPVFLAYFLCFIVGIRNMWRNATRPAGKQARTFSLKTLLVAQLIILSLCGLWIAIRRSEIDSLYKLQREQTRQAIP